ncbi:HNH endonuclease [Sinorhizobium meliloti]|nr:HNH endonuclease [Sinorhizobium meliloti]RVO41341.1 HNH endonuclease [Sinorhizobium meliloti]
MTKDIDQEIGRTLAKTKKEAIERGERFYFTGEPCVHGHIDVRYTVGNCCRECARIAYKKRYDANSDVILKRSREWQKKNPDKLKAWRAKWYEENKHILSEKTKAKRAEDPEKYTEKGKRWKIQNPEKYKESYKKTYERKKSTPKGKLEYSLSSGVRRGIAKGSKYGRRTFELLGYSLEQLMVHLEKQFSDGMSWENYGEWHIDHIIPLAAFNYETPDDADFKRAWALSNLQPLWAEANWKKNAKIDKPFQPSLRLQVPANDNNPPRSKKRRTDGA